MKKVLVYGAGTIGCYLAHVLVKAGNDVTLLARGAWKQNLVENGLIIDHVVQAEHTVDHPNVISVAGDEAYDCVFAVMQHQQMMHILPDLARIHAPIVVLVGNNPSPAEMEKIILAQTQTPKTVVFAFQLTAGHRAGDHVVCARLAGGSMTLGGLHDEVDAAVKAVISDLFERSVYVLNWTDDMEGWYKCHLAVVLPITYLTYAAGCDLRHATPLQRRQMIEATREGFELLKAMGIRIQPEKYREYYREGFKRRLMSVMMFFLCKTSLGDLIAAGHCRAAVTEMEDLDDAWRRMRTARPDIAMPNWDALHRAKPDWKTLHHQYDRMPLKVPVRMAAR